MENGVRLFLLLFFLIILPSNTYAELKPSNDLAKDIGHAYGFYMGQSYSLSEISKKFPSITGFASLADKEFSASFNSSINRMDDFMAKYSKSEWDKIKEQLSLQIAGSIAIENVSETEARQFIDIVRERAKGKIDSPVIETLLLFKAGYQNNPEIEFLDGYKYRYSTNGSEKSKGVSFSIESPKTWIAKEGDRPNVVQKFVSENGRGFEVLLILIKELPLRSGEIITENDVLEMLDPKRMQDFVPDGGIYLGSGKITLENMPGFWLHFKAKVDRMKNTVEMETIMYTVFYENRMIQIQGQVITSINGKPSERGGLKKYEKVFELMANSLVISDIYN